MSYVEVTPDNVEPCTRKEYEQLLSGTKTVSRYQCPLCRELKDGEYNITKHLLDHAVDTRIRQLWEQGKTLKEIDNLYHIFHRVYDDRPESDDSFLACHHNITKDNCFKISYLQCCDYPAYKITAINHDGVINVWGVGGWSGGYGSKVSLGCLRDPRPLSELYVDKRGK
jgi:hypothetical protein